MKPAILVAYDGSPYSKAALLEARQLAEKLGARLTVLIVLPEDAPEQGIVEEARRLAPDVEVVVERMATGFENPASVIATYAERNGYSLIVVGAKGFSSREDSLIGSTALWLAANAPVSVLIVRGGLGIPAGPASSQPGGSDP